MPVMNTTTQAVYVDEAFSKRVQHHTESNLVIADLIARFDDEVSESGNKVNVPFDTELEANDKVSGVDVSAQNPTDTEVEIDLDRHKESSFYVEDFLKFQSHIPTRDRYSKNASYAIRKAIDTDLASLATGFSQSKGTYNTAITTDVVLDAIELLDVADVPEEDRHFVFGAGVKRDLLDISTYTSSDFVSGKPVETGKISGMLYGVNTKMSQNILKSGNNTSNMLFHRDAIAMALQVKPRMQMQYKLEKLAWLTVVDAIYGFKELRDDFGVEVRT